MTGGQDGSEANLSVLTVNAGSATLKCALFETGAAEPSETARIQLELEGRDPRAALSEALEALGASPGGIRAVGHRIVHGGPRLVDPVEVDAEVEREIEKLSRLAPLHNPIGLAFLRAAAELMPHASSVAVFDTAFHARRSEASRRYALPRELAEREGLYRYGFHGIAHASLVEALARHEGVGLDAVDAVTLQLGRGCSACAVSAGCSEETSMGFTPLEGLPMGTRSGDVDPALVLHLMRLGWTPDRLEDLLERRSGLVGLSGSADMRVVLERASRGDEDAVLARDLFVRRVVLVVGAYFTLLGGRGSLVFGGGIGEHSPEVRRRVCDGLAAWGVALDPTANETGRVGRISAGASRPVYVLPTDEERQIARATAALVGGDPARTRREVTL